MGAAGLRDGWRTGWWVRNGRRGRPTASSAGFLGDRDDPFEPSPPGVEPVLIGEEDEERVVAGEGPLLLGQRRLVDRLGDHARGSGRAGDEQDQAAPADRDRDVDEDPAKPLVA